MSMLGAPSMIEGYLKKRAVKSGRNWKKRYFVLRTDGSLSYADKAGDSPKRTIKITSRTVINLIREGKEKHKDGGFTIAGPDHHPIFLRAPDSLVADGWVRALNLCVTQGESGESDVNRARHLEAFASTNKAVFLKRNGSRGRQSRSNSLASTGSLPSLPRSPTAMPRGYTMRVGNKDMFVKAEDWEVYENIKCCAKGDASLGEAKLEDLV